MTLHLALSIIATALLAAGIVLAERPGGDGRVRRLLPFGASVLGGLMLMSYLQIWPVAAKAERPVNLHDVAHYYLGSKYFREIGYSHLYLCAYEASGRPASVRTLRELPSRVRKPAAELAPREGPTCATRFEPARWSQFVWDVLFFRQQFSDDAWRAFLNDHGFNATPTWIALAGTISNRVDLSVENILALAWIDRGILASLFVVLIVLMGPLAAGIAFTVLTGFAVVQGGWVLGAFLRWDWIALAALAIAFAHRNRPAIAGALLALAGGLRVIPFFALAAALVLVAWQQFATGDRDRFFGRLFAGAAAGAAVAFVAPMALLGTDVWWAFALNLNSLEATPALNDMGLRTSLTYALEWLGQAGPVVDRNFAAHKSSYFAYVMPVQLGVLAWAGWRFLKVQAKGPAMVLPLSFALLPFAWGEVSHYYYAVWIVLALAAAQAPVLALPLLAGNVLTAAVAAAVGETMARYALFSLAVSASALAMLWLASRQPSTERV